MSFINIHLKGQSKFSFTVVFLSPELVFSF